jgi:hypothetical protein
VSFMKQSAFYLGLIAGLATTVAAGTILLTYLFTGKLPVVNMAENDKARMQLFTPDEIVALMRKQTLKAEAATETSAEIEG